MLGTARRISHLIGDSDDSDSDSERGGVGVGVGVGAGDGFGGGGGYGEDLGAAHPTVGFFWAALRAMSAPEQESVLMFVFARRRLPPAHVPWSWPAHFTLMRMGRNEPDSSLPCSHTCSFQLDLPEYSSAEVCRRQLLRAASSCIAYDLDGGARGVEDR